MKVAVFISLYLTLAISIPYHVYKSLNYKCSSMQRSLVKCFQFQVIHTISPPIAPVPIELERIPENPIRFARVHIAIFTFFSWKFKQRQILAIIKQLQRHNIYFE